MLWGPLQALVRFVLCAFLSCRGATLWDPGQVPFHESQMISPPNHVARSAVWNQPIHLKMILGVDAGVTQTR